MKIKNIHAIEILDSRGMPTISTEIELLSGDKAKGEVPSGASTGENEVLELRDEDEKRYGGKGVLKAIENINTVIREAVIDKDFESQKQFDDLLNTLDGTPNKSKLGGNAILSCSMAFCRAASVRVGLELYQYLGMIYWGEGYSENKFKLPRPQILLLEGGKHGNWSTDIQEFMIIPKENAFSSFRETLRASSEIFHKIHDILDSQGYSVGVGYEGAYSPMQIQSNKEALDIIVEGIKIAGYDGKFEIAIDVASSEFFNKETNKYELKRENTILSASEWFNMQKDWYSQYPMYSIEDPMDQNAWADWSLFTSQLGSKYQIVGDDLLVTNTKLIQKGIQQKSMNSVLIKLNQIGSVSETIDAINTTKSFGWKVIVSHRSGETLDDFIADLAVGAGADFLKAGSPAKEERMVKYSRVVEIENELK